MHGPPKVKRRPVTGRRSEGDQLGSKIGALNTPPSRSSQAATALKAMIIDLHSAGDLSHFATAILIRAFQLGAA
jgi:hypothetical protein